MDEQNRIRTIQELNESVESLHTLGDYNLEKHVLVELLLQLKDMHVEASDVLAQNQGIKDIYLIDLPNLQVEDDDQLIVFIHNLWVLLQAQRDLDYDSDNSQASNPEPVSVIPDFFLDHLPHLANGPRKSRRGKSKKSKTRKGCKKCRKGRTCKKCRSRRKSRKSRKH